MARQYTLSLVGVGDASINTSAAELSIIIASSDDIHGVVSFSSLSSSFEEDVGSVDIEVLRSSGFVGDLIVNFTAEDRDAISPGDYSVSAASEWYTHTHTGNPLPGCHKVVTRL